MHNCVLNICIVHYFIAHSVQLSKLIFHKSSLILIAFFTTFLSPVVCFCLGEHDLSLWQPVRQIVLAYHQIHSHICASRKQTFAERNKSFSMGVIDTTRLQQHNYTLISTNQICFLALILSILISSIFLDLSLGPLGLKNYPRCKRG